MPSAKAWHIDRIVDALDRFSAVSTTRSRRRTHILIEYVLIDGVNASEELAHQLGKLLQGKDVLINVIPYNPTDVPHDYKPPSRATTDRFNEVVRSYGLRTIIRQELGQDVNAACGQLVVRSQRDAQPAAAGHTMDRDLEDLAGRPRSTAAAARRAAGAAAAAQAPPAATDGAVLPSRRWPWWLMPVLVCALAYLSLRAAAIV